MPGSRCPRETTWIEGWPGGRGAADKMIIPCLMGGGGERREVGGEMAIAPQTGSAANKPLGNSDRASASLIAGQLFSGDLTWTPLFPMTAGRGLMKGRW